VSNNYSTGYCFILQPWECTTKFILVVCLVWWTSQADVIYHCCAGGIEPSVCHQLTWWLLMVCRSLLHCSPVSTTRSLISFFINVKVLSCCLACRVIVWSDNAGMCTRYAFCITALPKIMSFLFVPLENSNNSFTSNMAWKPSFIVGYTLCLIVLVVACFQICFYCRLLFRLGPVSYTNRKLTAVSIQIGRFYFYFKP